MEISELKSLIECIVCYEVQRQGYIYHCENGHNVCAKCKSSLQKCPMGRCRYLGNSRNLTAEKLRNNRDMQFPCQYAENGCEIVQKETELDIHELECSFRMIKCSYGCGKILESQDYPTHKSIYHIKCKNKLKGCNFNGTFDDNQRHNTECGLRSVPCPESQCKKRIQENELLNHMKSNHNSYTRNLSGSNSISLSYFLRRSVNRRNWRRSIVSFDNQYFVIGFQVFGQNMYHSWIQIIGKVV